MGDILVKIKKLGVLSSAKIQAILMAIIGLILGIFVAIIASLGAAISSTATDGAGFMVSLGVAAIIVLPILYGTAGFVFGAIGALLYNLVASWVGGIEVELEQ